MVVLETTELRSNVAKKDSHINIETFVTGHT